MVAEHEVMSQGLIIQAMTFKQAVTLLREFGATPAARARVLIDPQLPLFPGSNDQTKQSKDGSYFT